MPGFWELKPNQSVLLCTLHTDFTTIAWSFALAKMEGITEMHGLAGMPFDHARNEACKNALRLGADWLFFLDSDVLCPHDTIPRLLSHGQPLISGVYCRRSPPAGVPVMMRGGDWVYNLPEPRGVMEVDVVGAGCLLIHRSLLESLPPQREGKHWFDWRVDLKEHQPLQYCLSEDFAFCQHARAHGYKVLVDTSIRCKHVGFFECTYKQAYPLGATPPEAM